MPRASPIDPYSIALDDASADPPSPRAASIMDGFDDLPQPLRDLFNYHAADMNDGDSPFRTLLDAIHRRGHSVSHVLRIACEVLDIAAAQPDRFADTRNQNRE